MRMRLSIYEKIENAIKKGTDFLLAIDGRSASGKTTLAEDLHKKYDSNIFHMDDFFLQKHQRTKERYEEPGGNVDRERFEEEVLIPLSRKENVKYKRLDCATLTLMEPLVIPYKKINIIEGSYSMHPELIKFYDYKIFVDIDDESQKKRILDRNGKDWGEDFFTKWIPLEDKYIKTFDIRDKADIWLETHLENFIG